MGESTSEKDPRFELSTESRPLLRDCAGTDEDDADADASGERDNGLAVRGSVYEDEICSEGVSKVSSAAMTNFFLGFGFVAFFGLVRVGGSSEMFRSTMGIESRSNSSFVFRMMLDLSIRGLPDLHLPHVGFPEHLV